MTIPALSADALRLRLQAVAFRRLTKSALEGPDEAGMVTIANRVRNFFDRKVTRGEKFHGFLQPAFRQQAPQLQPGLLFEQSLDVSRAEGDLSREIPDRIRGIGFYHLQDLS